MSEAKAKSKRAVADDLLTLQGLADRWGGSLGIVKRMVRAGGVPFFSLTPTDVRINWDQVRFRLDSIIEFEKRRSVAIDAQDPPAEREREMPQKGGLEEWDWK